MSNNDYTRDSTKTAILIDGAFYRNRAYAAFGDKKPQDRADELESYCKRHLTEKINGQKTNHQLYRIFYYDCPPANKSVFNPLTQKNTELSKSPIYTWATEFYDCLKKKRKFALRFGKIADTQAYYNFKPDVAKSILMGKRTLDSITENDIKIYVNQKGVDMKIGLDIASLAYKKQVDQIILISGDSDFVSAAKLARREGIDFVLDPLGATIKPDLFEHIDGLRSCDDKFKNLK